MLSPLKEYYIEVFKFDIFKLRIIYVTIYIELCLEIVIYPFVERIDCIERYKN